MISLYHLASHTPPEAMYKENKMSRTNGQCRVLTITSLKMGTCVTTFKGFGDQKKFLGAPQNEKKTDFLNNPPSKKVVTHVPIFRLVIERPLQWSFVRDILFSLTLLQEGCGLSTLF